MQDDTREREILRDDLVVGWEYREKSAYAVAYDIVNRKIIWPLVDFSIYLSDERMLDPKSVEANILAVASYRRFLAAESRLDAARVKKGLGCFDFEESTDDLIRRFRDAENERVRKKINSNNDKYAAQRSVNEKLVYIYLFLKWWESKSSSRFMGSSALPVTSTLRDSVPESKIGRRRWGGDVYSKYPLLNRHTGRNSKQSRGYAATEKDRKTLNTFFLKNCTEYTAIRNILIMDIANELGWRRETINSLRCEQFSDERQNEMTHRGLACVPEDQKNGYRDSFYISPSLSAKIISFIRDVRHRLIQEMNWKISSEWGRVFISARDGKPLTDKAVSKIFSQAFASAGAPRRAGIKSFRNKFTNDQLRKETIARREQGLDTSTTSISAAVSMDLGHRSLESIKSYADANLTRIASRKRNP
ncbi:hypothetical protein VOI32_00985 [Paraburkholderia caribensis]|uniref:Tyr recombinase domain-containing protein n=1 Tax=Paraburkholderia caribensis TaxID=75105 RepID=A0ABV0DN32_9BURK|nr:hypothetical protein [Paraburkholderia caribensis]MCO4875603.1 hypothetical protein [Paraburkholderia caribensis]